MIKTTFKIDMMDCPSEERLIRMKLQDMNIIKSQVYDLKNRTLTVYHVGNYNSIEIALNSLDLGSHLVESEETEGVEGVGEDQKQRKVLWIVLIINFSFFLIEMATGVFSKSMGLVADSLDMLADAFVYGLSLLAVGAAVSRKKRVAMICGYFQILLALLGFIEVIKRFIGVEELPDFRTMIVISVLALIANIVCLVLLQNTKSNDAHIQASIIFSSNDVVINVGVILAALLVWGLETGIPDLIIGSIVFLIVLRGAIRILKLSRS
ncbi:MAG: cation transporter [Dysgonomonas sp.]